MNARTMWCPILVASLLLTACGDASDSSPENTSSAEGGAEEPTAERLRTQVLSGLNNLVGLQQAHYREHGSYSTDLDALGYDGDPAVGIDVRDADGDGWSVVASHEDLEAWSCVAFIGDVETVPMTSGGITPEAGRVECDPLPGAGETEAPGGGQPQV